LPPEKVAEHDLTPAAERRSAAGVAFLVGAARTSGEARAARLT
jgi:hypothetical protein